VQADAGFWREQKRGRGALAMNTYSKTNSRNGKPIFVNGMWIGQVLGDTFVKSLWSKNLLTKPYLAIANSVSALNDAEALGARYCEIFIRDTGMTYRATIKHIREKGETFDFRGDIQIKLILSEWEKIS
jgi:hypothetical protein